ncbi:MAG: amino acid dehydrogenase, partial [Pseudomonadota bacterium]
MPASFVSDSILAISNNTLSTTQNHIAWIEEEMSPYFLGLNQDEVDALSLLVLSLDKLENLQKVTLIDREERLMIAQLCSDGSIYDAIQDIPQHPLQYAEITTSFSPLPDSNNLLEVLRCDFAAPTDSVQPPLNAPLPPGTAEEIKRCVMRDAADLAEDRIDSVIEVFTSSNVEYVLKSPAERVARVVRSYIETQNNGGIYLQVEGTEYRESRISFGVTNPPHAGFLQQVLEVFKRLRVSVKRAYHLSVHNGLTPYFLANFYVTTKDNQIIAEESDLYKNLRRELYSTQITSTTAPGYTRLIKSGVMSGPDSTLISAIITFCHTNLAHNAPEVFDLDTIGLAYHRNLG